MKKPLIHCITNVVTVNDCANIILAAGGSPTMAHHPLEVAEIAAASGALVLNMGAMESYDAMMIAGQAAHAAGVSIVLDPVGAAGASYRRQKTMELIEAVHPTCIRGNYSEIKALALAALPKIQAVNPKTSNEFLGVDAAENEELSDKLLMKYADYTGAIIVASGAVDLIATPTSVMALQGGSPLMALVTGTGCMSTALLGLALARSGANSPATAIIQCLSFINDCAEKAEAKTKMADGGTMTFRMYLIDEVSK